MNEKYPTYGNSLIRHQFKIMAAGLNTQLQLRSKHLLKD